MLVAPDADDIAWGKAVRNRRYELLFFRKDSLVVVDFIPGGRLIQNRTRGLKQKGVKSLH
jgi:hypothetical protein